MRYPFQMKEAIEAYSEFLAFKAVEVTNGIVSFVSPVGKIITLDDTLSVQFIAEAMMRF